MDSIQLLYACPKQKTSKDNTYDTILLPWRDVVNTHALQPQSGYAFIFNDIHTTHGEEQCSVHTI